MFAPLVLQCLWLANAARHQPSLQVDANQRSPPALRQEPNEQEFWGIHDLLLGGYRAPFMKEGSGGKAEVQEHAFLLATMVKTLHPVARCREQMQPLTLDGDKQKFCADVAAVALTCLNLEANSFKHNFKTGREPANAIIGTCTGSKWPMACSIWISLHAMARLADEKPEPMSLDFVKSVFAVIAGGATECGGCTRHFLWLNSQAGILSPELLADTGPGYCSMMQCGMAGGHVDQLEECEKSRASCDGNSIKELEHRTAWKQYLEVATSSGDPAATNVFAGLHNLITESISPRFIDADRRGYFCTKEGHTTYSRLDDLPADSDGNLHFPPLCQQ